MKILAVDDELDMQALFEQRFRKEIRDHRVDFAFANSGADAIDYLDKHLHEDVLILSDINMPGMSGFDLLLQIKNKYNKPAPTVMMVTAYSDPDSYNRAMQLGADDFLTKPIDFTLLKAKLHLTS
ncbi:MAG: Fis family transcriptional regulator [Sphingobacteriales bacterium]|nr:Fis family transcriptional regulator [Sphingobacteriales bacterium]